MLKFMLVGLMAIIGIYLFPPLQEVYDRLYTEIILPFNPPAFSNAVAKSLVLIFMVGFFVSLAYALFHRESPQGPGGE